MSHLLWQPHYFFKGLMRVIRKIEMRELNFLCAAIAQNFLLIFYYSKLAENCMKSTVFGRKNENLCHLTVVRTTHDNYSELDSICTIFRHPLQHFTRI